MTEERVLFSFRLIEKKFVTAGRRHQHAASVRSPEKIDDDGGGERLVASARALRDATGRLRFAAPVTHVYNPLEYAWAAHEIYLRRYGALRKRVIFLGMNPGPFGMAQTGIPFGEIAAVRDWLGIEGVIAQPAQQHPKRLITGFACTRREVSGRRLWALFAERFGTAEKFFAEHFVLNYCPLAFLETSGANRTPNKLPPRERERLFRLCDEHLRAVAAALAPEWIIGVGEFAAQRAREALGDTAIEIGRILHPSPASPAANRGWAAAASAELRELGVWD